jgi:hypothetical protein
VNENKIYLGKTKGDFDTLPNERIWLSKHSWDCGWYWGFGYIGNANIHTHFDSVFLNTSKYTPKDIFEKTKISEKKWWIIRDLMIQAYALKKAAEVYHHGGHQTTVSGVTDIIKNKELERQINTDLKTVLDKVWEILSNESEEF